MDKSQFSRVNLEVYHRTHRIHLKTVVKNVAVRAKLFVLFVWKSC